MRLALRALMRSPGFTAATVSSLTLGIAAATAMFSVIYGVILDPFPYKHPDTLMSIRVHEPNGDFNPYLTDHYLDIAEQSHIFESVIASTISDVLLAGTANPERLRGNFVTTNTFAIMGVAPLLGRYITAEDGAPGAPPVAVLGFRYWKSRFNGDPRVIGMPLRLNDKVRTVIGIMPKRFMWRGADVYLPIVFQRGKVVEGVRYINVIGRLKPGVSAAQADADLHPIVQEMVKREPNFHASAFHVQLRNFYETYPSSIRRQLWILLSAVALLLAIACANVSNMMLARTAARSREIAVRASLGAGRWAIAQPLLAESSIIGLASAVLGSVLAYGALSVVIEMVPPGAIPDESEISLNVPVLLVTLAVSLLTALLSGVAPALQSSRTGIAATLRESSRGFAGSFREGRLRKTLVAAEVALAMLLLIGASLVLRTLFNLQVLNLGFDPTRVLTMEIPLTENRYPSISTRNQLLTEMLGRIESLPGVDHAALNTFVHPFADWGVRVEVPGSTADQRRLVILDQISTAYTTALQIPLNQGHLFSDQDLATVRHVVLVNETFARAYFKDRDALGQIVRVPQLQGPPIGLSDVQFTIQGVVGDVRNVGLDRETYPEIYVPYTVTGFREFNPVLLVTAHTPVGTLSLPIQREIHSIDPNQPVMRVKTAEKMLADGGFSGPRFSVFLFGAFAALGLSLCIIGVYGVVNYSVSRQTQSLGVRSALGARTANILSLVLKEALQVVAAGIVAGVFGGLVATRAMTSLIWGVSPADPVSFSVVAVVLLMVGLVACLRPAWRAARLDPAIVLRQD